jgi:hypothetical protein
MLSLRAILNLFALFIVLVQGQAQADSAVSLLSGKSSEVRVCNDRAASKSTCEQVALALTKSQSGINVLSPSVLIPRVEDDRLKGLGRSCPPSGADAKGDGYLPFELEYDGWQTLPAGPFELYDIGSIYPKWHARQVLVATGYDYEQRRLSNGQALLWKAYYVASSSCPPILISALYHRGRERVSKQVVGDDLVVWQGRVLIIDAQEEPIGSNRFYVSVDLIPETQPTNSERAGRIVLMSFVAR